VRLRTQLFGGGFASAIAVKSDVPASGLTVGDVNGDHRNDFALDGALTGSIPVFTQNTDHTFTERDGALPPEITGVTGVSLTDVDADGNNDLLVITDDDELSWALADGTGGFGAFSTAIPASAVSAKATAELKGGGLPDPPT